MFQGDGKWSVHGSPCDYNHGEFRKYTDAAEEVGYILWLNTKEFCKRCIKAVSTLLGFDAEL